MLRVVTTSGWIASRDLFECRLARWSTIESDVAQRAHFEYLQSQGDVQPSSLLLQWFNTARCSFVCVFLLSFLQEDWIRNVGLMRNDDDRQRVEDPFSLIPDVGDEAVSAEVQSTFLWWRICVRVGTRYIEREREAQSRYVYSNLYNYYNQQ